MGLALSVLHGAVPEDVVDVALSSPFLVHVPLAPGEALLLANAGFWDAKREEMRLDVANDLVQTRIAEYKVNVLYPHIALLLHTPKESNHRARRLSRKGGDGLLQVAQGESGNGGRGEDGDEAMKELVFDGFSGQLGRYVFPAPQGNLEGWSLLLSEYQKWKVCSSRPRAYRVWWAVY